MTSEQEDRGERRGLALGPMTFVPELRVVGSHDPWAHRKGEPRVFALLWAMYLLIAAVLTVFSVRALGYPRTSQFVFGGLSMLTVAMVGIMLLWPALRLGQATPERPTTAALFDLAVVLLPVHAIVWPLSMLTGWPWTVTVGILLMISGWGMVSAGIIAITLGQCRAPGAAGATRLLSMLLLIVLCIGPPAFRLLAMQGGRFVPGLVDLASPLSAPWAMGMTAEGQLASMSEEAWLACGLVVGAGLTLLGVSGLAARFGSGEASSGGQGLPRRS